MQSKLLFYKMAGIYLHIPFCKKACHYCNFHFSTTLTLKNELLTCLRKEIELQKEYLSGVPINSIYFGGGTPSLLSIEELNAIFNTIYSNFEVEKDIEITLESNPDDLTEDYCIELKKSTPVNRLSIGIQSFNDECLSFMNRAHSGKEAIAAIENAQKADFENLTIDFIYGTPTLSDEQWISNLNTAFAFNIPHLSCYNLTVEENTALNHFVKKGKQKPVDEMQSARQFQILVEKTAVNGFEHYEISNYAKSGFRAIHNSSYWEGIPYLGIGPSAHSFDGNSRQSNIANNALYIKSLSNNEMNFEKEVLTLENIHNEYVMTSLRTSWGCDPLKINPFFAENFNKKIAELIEKGWITQNGKNYILTFQGKLLADHIAVTLFE